jgi:hypothetical protein
MSLDSLPGPVPFARHPVRSLQWVAERLQTRWEERAHPPPSDRAFASGAAGFVAALAAIPEEEAARRLSEVPRARLLADTTLAIGEAFAGRKVRLVAPDDPWVEALSAFYALVRLRRPHRILENGAGLVGATSTFLLAALAANGTGELWSVDPDPAGAWAHPAVGLGIPGYLRDRHHRIGGRSAGPVERALGELSPVELVLLDGGRPYSTLRRDISSAWSRLAPGGLLLAEDLRSSALDDFARGQGTRPLYLPAGGRPLGALRRGRA